MQLYEIQNRLIGVSTEKANKTTLSDIKTAVIKIMVSPSPVKGNATSVVSGATMYQNFKTFFFSSLKSRTTELCTLCNSKIGL